MTTLPEPKDGVPTEQEDGGFSEEAANRQFMRMLKEAEARLPEGYEIDWERGAVVLLDPTLPRHPWCDHD